MLALWGSGQVGAAELSTYPQSAGRSCRSGSRGPPFAAFDRRAVFLVAGQAARAMEDGKVAVGIFVHTHFGLDVVVAMAACRDLQAQVLVAHRVVIADHTVLLHTEDVRQVAGERHEGGGCVLGRPGEAGIVGRQEVLFQEPVGGRHIGDAGEIEFLRQAFLQGAEHALRAAPGLRRIGRDQLNTELLQGTSDLGWIVLVDLAAGLRRVPIVRGPVCIKRAEQPHGRPHLVLQQRHKARHGALLGDEEGGIDLRSGIVHGHDQVPVLTRHPLVRGAVLVQHHADHRPARPLAAVHAAPRRRRDPAVRLERQPHPVVTARDVVLCNQLLPEVPGGEMPVPGIEQTQQCHHLVDPGAARGNPTQAAVVKTLRALGLKAIAPASERALGHAQDLGCLQLAQCR